MKRVKQITDVTIYAIVNQAQQIVDTAPTRATARLRRLPTERIVRCVAEKIIR